MNWTRRKGDSSVAGSTAADRSLSFEACTDIEEFRSLRPEWDELFQRANGEYFQSFEYCNGSLMAEHAGTKRKLLCIVGRRGGKLVAVWPLLTSYRTCWKFAEPLTPQNQAPSDILVAPEPDADAIVQAAWRKTLALSRADVFEFWRIRKTSPLYACLTSQSITRRATEEFTPIATLRDEPDWTAYCRTRPSRERNAPEYLKRRLAKHGQFSMELIDASDERLVPLIEWFVAQKRKWASEKASDSHWVFSDASLRFWKALLAGESKSSGVFRLFVLTFEGQPIAANILGISSGFVYLVANTYDLEHKKLSPGTILVDECVKWAYDNRLDFDFGPGEQRYKTSWSAGAKYATSSFMVLATPWGQTGSMAKQFVKETREKARRVVSRVVRRADVPAVSEE